MSARVAAYTRMPLRSFSRADARALDTVHRLRIPRIAVAGRVWRFAWWFGAPSALPAESALRIGVEWRGHPVVLRVPRWLFEETLSFFVPQLQGAPIPDALLHTVLHAVAAAWLKSLPGARIRAVETDGARAETGAGLRWLAATIRTPGSPDAGAALSAPLEIGIGAAALRALAHHHSALPRRQGSVSGLRLRLRCQVGSQTLALTELRGLQRGDIVFVNEHLSRDAAPELRFYASTRCVFCAEVGPTNTVTVTGMGMNHDDNMLGDEELPQPFDGYEAGAAADRASGAESWPPPHPVARDDEGLQGEGGAPDEDRAARNSAGDAGLGQVSDVACEGGAAGPGAPGETIEAGDSAESVEVAGLDDIPVMVTFDVGQCELTVGELRNLVDGSILELGRPISDAVNLRVGGKLIGVGELVEIDGRIGVLVAQCGTAR